MTRGVPKSVKKAAEDFKRHVRMHLPARAKVFGPCFTMKPYPLYLKGERLGCDEWRIEIPIQLGGLNLKIPHPELFYV